MDQNSVYYKVFRVVCYFLMAMLVIFGADKYYDGIALSAVLKIVISLVITALLAIGDFKN